MKSVQIETAGLPAILQQIAAFYPEAEGHFVKRSAWLVNARSMSRLMAGSLGAGGLPAFKKRRLMSLLLKSLGGERLTLPTTADALQISLDGFRLRAFDLDRARSYKVVAVDSRYGPLVDGDVQTRRDLLPGSGLLFPKTHQLIRRGSHVLLEDELVLGRPWNVRRDGRRIMGELAEPLAGLARHHGVSRRPLDGLLPSGAGAALADADHSLPLVAHLASLVERNPLVAVSLCHCDVSASNLAVGAAGTVFLDWETAREHFVGYDLMGLARRYANRRHVRDAARHFHDSFQTDGFSFADGMAFVLLLDGLKSPTLWEKLSAEWRAFAA